VKIVADLHSRGLVHGSIMTNAFVVDQQGNLYLSQFDNMRVEDPNAPFFPMNNPLASAMAFMAPELLQSMRDNGVASLSRATDIYALGCFGYEVWLMTHLSKSVELILPLPFKLLTGTDPFSRYTHCATQPMAQAGLITAVVDRRERPERRGVGTSVWNMLEACWVHAAASRPTAPVLLQHLATVI
jgi:serine/threonine protein kinase